MATKHTWTFYLFYLCVDNVVRLGVDLGEGVFFDVVVVVVVGVF